MFSDRVKQTTSSTGVVDFQIDDTLLTGFASFRSAFSPTSKCYYVANDVLGNYEIGIGTFISGSPDSFSRDTILSSTNNGDIVPFPVGLKYIYNSLPSDFLSNLVQTSGLSNGLLPITNQYGWLIDSSIYSDGSNISTNGAISGTINHNSLLNYIANEHINHTGVVLTAVLPLSGGGDISVNRSFSLGGLSTYGTADYLLGVNANANALEYKRLVGTVNQINIVSGVGLLTLSLPQNIAVASSPTFVGLTLTGLTSGRVPYVTTGGLFTDSANFAYDGTSLNLISNSTNYLKMTGTNSVSLTSTYFYTVNIIPTYNGSITGSNSPTWYGMYFSPTINSIVNTSGPINIRGVVSVPIVGGIFLSLGASSDIFGMYGLPICNGSGIFPTVNGIVASYRSSGGYAIITNGRSLYIPDASKTSNGSITNNYGIYIENQTAGGTLNYAIYSVGGNSYFGGNIGINEIDPNYKLDVNGTFGCTPGTSVTPVDNGDLIFEATSNTQVTFKLKGSDGTIRSGILTLA